MAKNIKELTLKWVMLEDKIVRFVELNDASEITDEIAKLDFEKAGMVAGAKVSVEFDANNKVIFITLVKGAEAPKQEPKADDKPSEAKEAPKESLPTNTKVLTVGGLSPKYRGITFKEEKDVWYDVVNEIGIENLEKMGIVRGSSVEVTIGEPEGKSKNKRIVGIKLAEKKEAPKENEKPTGNNDFDKEKSQDSASDVVTEKDAFFRIKELERTIRFLKDEKQASIESNSAVERAFTLIGVILSKESPESFVKNEVTIKAMLKTYAQEAYNLIQELKQKKS